MLPVPISYNARGSPPRRSFLRHGPHKSTSKKLSDVLLTRSRITNLGFVLLAFFATCSLLLNLSYYYSGSKYLRRRPPQSVLATMSHTESSALKHLIIVPGHSIWRGANAADRLNEDDWILEPYQRGGGRVAAFYDHIAKGVELAVNDPQALLVFSGGQTRSGSTTTEGESYLRLALSANLFKMPSSQPHFPRATTEDFALDSFQNLLFSVARFHEFTGRYPESITVVGYEMKRRRFVELHRSALRWPIHRFHYIGADPLGDEAAQAQEGEKKNGYLPYSQDLYGCHSYLLSKRRQRNPFLRFHPYHSSAPELADLLDWCPDTPVMTFSGSLPWSS